ncbi:MAG: MATE family efflux transporter, partial [Flavobacteriales bacterium]
RNFFMLAFIVTQGMQQTTRTYVSGLLGAGRLEELDQTLRRLFTLTFIGILLLCHGYILYPDHLAAVFFTDAAGQEAMVKTLHLLFIAVCTYAFTGIMLSTIQGSGATNVAFRVELAAVTIYMVVAAALTLIWPQPIWVIWRVELVYFSSIGLGSWLYLRKGTWRHITQPS